MAIKPSGQARAFPNAALTPTPCVSTLLQRIGRYAAHQPKSGSKRKTMWFLAGMVMLLLGAGAAMAGGGESHGAITPANAALVAAILSLLILPAERSLRR